MIEFLQAYCSLSLGFATGVLIAGTYGYARDGEAVRAVIGVAGIIGLIVCMVVMRVGFAGTTRLLSGL